MNRSSGFGRRSLLKTAALLPAAALLGKRGMAADRVLNLYNWDDYIAESAIDAFASETGAKVRLDLFADGEQQFAKLRAGGSGYDVTFPTHDFVSRMTAAGMLLPLDHSLIPNVGHLFKLHRDPAYDPGNRHSIPYMWGSMGLAYRKSAAARPTSWRDVFTPEGVERSGRVAWLSEASSMVPAASMMLDRSANDLSEDNLDEVFGLLQAAKQHITKIAPDNGQDLLASGEVDVVVEWNGDIAQLIAEDDDIGFVFPDEGSLYYVDCMCILADSGEPELAHAFLDFVLREDVGREIAEHILYATPNEAAYRLTDISYRSNPVTFPPEGTGLQVFGYPGEEALDRLYRRWERLIAG